MSEHTTVLPEYSPQPEPRKSLGRRRRRGLRRRGRAGRGGWLRRLALVLRRRSAAGRGAAGVDLRPRHGRPGPLGWAEGRGHQDAAEVPELPRPGRPEARLRPAQAALRRGPEGRRVQGPRLRARRQVLDRPAPRLRWRGGRRQGEAGGRPAGQRRRQREDRVPAAGQVPGDVGLRLDPHRRLHRDQRQHRARQADRRGRQEGAARRRTPTSRSGPTRRAAPGS